MLAKLKTVSAISGSMGQRSGDGLSERLRRPGILVLVSLWLILVSGCASTNWVRMRRTPDTPMLSPMQILSWGDPEATPRTQQFLRRNDLIKMMKKDPELVVQWLMENDESLSTENVFALAEVSFLAAQRAEKKGKTEQALDLYGLSVANAYGYLLSDELADERNPYDPRFRQASDLYNGALENAMRLIQKRGQLRPGSMLRVRTEKKEYEVHLVCRGPWQPEDIAELKFVSDYELQGLKNHYRTFGLGVPLIAVYNRESSRDPTKRYAAPGMSFPVTAFLRVEPDAQLMPQGRTKQVCVLELYDPLMSSDVVVNDRLVPLQTDLSTPLAYSLNDSEFQRANVATRGFLNVAESQQAQGLYLLEPYDPNKIPVIMIHGLWSSLITWMEMFNDLRGTPEIRDHYQFWFYLYPTGQPFLVTAAQLRRDLEEARDYLDPQHATPTLDEMILVGHSMGGLISRLQTLDSGDRFRGFAETVSASDLMGAKDGSDPFDFHPNPSIQRVVTIASPHRGSAFSNGATQWLGRRLIRMPAVVLQSKDQLLQAAAREKRPTQGAWAIQTSIDSLSPASPVLEAMQHSPPGEWVQYHNIVGRIANEGVLSKVAKESDGVVTLTSAHLEDAVSELVVEADHINIHRHPRAILEMQRILRLHLHERNRQTFEGP